MTEERANEIAFAIFMTKSVIQEEKDEIQTILAKLPQGSTFHDALMKLV